jgi:hypothetical protein
MPTEFWEKDGSLVEFHGQPVDHSLTYSTYQVERFFPVDIGMLLNYCIENGKDISLLEKSDKTSIADIALDPKYEAASIGACIRTPHGEAQMLITYHKMPDQAKDFMQVITISEGNLPTRYVHLILHTMLLYINDADGIDTFVEDDTPKHIAPEIILGMIKHYAADKQDQSKRSKANYN